MDIQVFAAGALETNCYVVSRESDCIVIDPGHGAAAKVREYVAQRDLTVDCVVLTHGHLDHTRDAGEVAEDFNVPVYMHPADRIMVTHAREAFGQLGQLLDVANMQTPGDLRPFDSSQEQETPEAKVGGRATLSTAIGELTIVGGPGHSPGSCLLLLDDVCFSGDILFAGAIGRTDLPGSSPQSMLSTLRDVVVKLPEMPVYPGHGPGTTVEKEKAANPYLRGL